MIVTPLTSIQMPRRVAHVVGTATAPVIGAFTWWKTFWDTWCDVYLGPE